MRSEAEIRRAVKHITEANSDWPDGAMVDMKTANSVLVKLLNWVLGEDNSFQTEVMKACDAIDRAERQ